MTQTVLLLFFMLTPSFGFAEGNHGKDTRLLHPNAEPRVQFLTKEMIQLLESSEPAKQTLGWNSVQAKLRELRESKKQVLRDDAVKLVDLVMKDFAPSVASQRALILLFEVSPEMISDMLKRSHGDVVVEECAFLGRVSAAERTGKKGILDAALRALLAANDRDPRSTAQLVRDVFQVPKGAVDPKAEEERQRKLKLVAIALAHHTDAIPPGLSRSDLIGVLGSASHDSNWFPGRIVDRAVVVDESLRAFQKVFTPVDKEASLADILKNSPIHQWDGRRTISQDLAKKNFSSVKLSLRTRWIAVRSVLPLSIRCVSGCLTQRPFLIEASSGIAIFGVIPSSDPKEHPVVALGMERIQLPPPPPGVRPGMAPRIPVPQPPVGRGVFRNAPLELIPVRMTKVADLPEAGQPFPFPNWGKVSVFQITEDLNVPKFAGDLLAIRGVAEARKYRAAIQKAGPEGDLQLLGEYEVSFPVLSYARVLEEALQSNGFLVEQPRKEPLEVSAHRSLVRLRLLLSTANAHVGAADGTVSARVAFLRQALPQVSYELARNYLPDLERQASLLAASYTELQKTHALVTKGLASLSRLSDEDAFALLGYATDSLRIEKPRVIADKAQLGAALSGVEEHLRRELVALAERKAMTCRLIRLFQFPGTPLLPAVLSGEKIKKVCP